MLYKPTFRPGFGYSFFLLNRDSKSIFVRWASGVGGMDAFYERILMKKNRIIDKIFDKLVDHPWILSFTLALLATLFVLSIVAVLSLISFLLDPDSTLKLITGVLVLVGFLAVIIRCTMLL